MFLCLRPPIWSVVAFLKVPYSWLSDSPEIMNHHTDRKFENKSENIHLTQKERIACAM